MRQSHHLPTLSVKKNFWDIFLKIRFHSFVELDLENRLSTHNVVLSLELKAKKNIWWKIQKTALECPFEIIGFKCWPKLPCWKIWCPSFLKPGQVLFYYSQNNLKLLSKIHHILCTKLCINSYKNSLI